MAQTPIEGSDIGSPSSGAFSGTLRFTSIGVLIVVTLVAFEAMAVSTAMPTAARDLHGQAHYGWAFSAFIVANIVGLVASGVLSDRRGPKPSFVVGLSSFLAGLLVTGTATTMVQFVAGRVVQGFGAGMLVTAIYVVIGESYPGQVRPKIFAAISSAWVLPSLLGPPLSGFLTQQVGWRWVFLGLVPLVVVGSGLLAPQLGRMSGQRRQGAVTAGAGVRVLRAVAAAGAIAVLIQAGQDPEPLWLASGVVALLVVGWAVHGLIPAGTVVLRSGVPATVALRGLLAGAMFGVDAFIPLALTVQHGFRPTAAGLPLLGAAVAWSVGSWWQGRDAMNGRRPTLIRWGFGFLTIGITGAAIASLPALPGWLMYAAWPFAGIGAGLAMSSIGVLMLAQTNDAERGRDSSALQLADGVVSSFTIGLGGVLVAAAARGHLTYTTAFVTLDLAMVGIAVLGIVVGGRAAAAEHRTSGAAEPHRVLRG